MICSTPSLSLYVIRSGSRVATTGPGSSWLAKVIGLFDGSCGFDCTCSDMLR